MVNYITERDILDVGTINGACPYMAKGHRRIYVQKWLFFELECFDALGVYSISCIGCRMPFRPKL